MKRRLRGPAALATTALTALGAAGCAVFSPVQTQLPYEPGDGFSTSVGTVEVRNAVVVSEGEGAPGVVSATFVNNEPSGAEITVAAGGVTSPPVSVPAGVVVVFGDGDPGLSATVGVAPSASPEPAMLQLPSVDAVPGELVPVTFTSDNQSVELQVPVVLPRFEYAPLAPGATGTGGPTDSPSPARPTDDPEPLGGDTGDATETPLPRETEPPAQEDPPADS